MMVVVTHVDPLRNEQKQLRCMRMVGGQLCPAALCCVKQSYSVGYSPQAERASQVLHKLRPRHHREPISSQAIGSSKAARLAELGQHRNDVAPGLEPTG